MIAHFPVPEGIECWPVTDREGWLRRRERDNTASTIGALLGVHEYVTEFKLWAYATGQIEHHPEESPVMERGNMLEPVNVEMLRRKYPHWKIIYPVGFYYRNPATRIGATPDAQAIDPARPGFGNIQLKSVHPRTFRNEWLQDGVAEPPTWIIAQSVVETSLTGASWNMVSPLVVDYGIEVNPIEIPTPKIEKIMARLGKRSLEFWDSVANKQAPPMDFKKDAETIRALYSDADESNTVDLSTNNRVYELVANRDALKARESDGNSAEKERKEIDAEIIAMLGPAAYGRLADGRLISAKTTKRKGYTVADTSFRTVRIKA